jgi:hypothetical protein
LPTYERLPRFDRDYELLSPDEKRAFREAVTKFVQDIEGGARPRRGLRVKGVKGARGVFELTWANDGRATFQFGESKKGGEPHVIWRRVGTHAIFSQP